MLQTPPSLPAEPQISEIRNKLTLIWMQLVLLLLQTCWERSLVQTLLVLLSTGCEQGNVAVEFMGMFVVVSVATVSPEEWNCSEASVMDPPSTLLHFTLGLLYFTCMFSIYLLIFDLIFSECNIQMHLLGLQQSEGSKETTLYSHSVQTNNRTAAFITIEQLCCESHIPSDIDIYEWWSSSSCSGDLYDLTTLITVLVRILPSRLRVWWCSRATCSRCFQSGRWEREQRPDPPWIVWCDN